MVGMAAGTPFGGQAEYKGDRSRAGFGSWRPARWGVRVPVPDELGQAANVPHIQDSTGSQQPAVQPSLFFGKRLIVSLKKQCNPSNILMLTTH